MIFLTSAKDWIGSIFSPVPIEQAIAMIGEEAQIEIAQRDYAIVKERFGRHMAVAKLEAVRSWGKTS
jgi:hypothetical protein